MDASSILEIANGGIAVRVMAVIAMVPVALLAVTLFRLGVK